MFSPSDRTAHRASHIRYTGGIATILWGMQLRNLIITLGGTGGHVDSHLDYPRRVGGVGTQRG